MAKSHPPKLIKPRKGPISWPLVLFRRSIVWMTCYWAMLTVVNLCIYESERSSLFVLRSRKDVAAPIHLFSVRAIDEVLV